MYINFKLKPTNNWKAKALQEVRLDELEQLLGEEIYSSDSRKIFKLDKQKIRLIKWDRPTKKMLRELFNKKQNKTVLINTADENFRENYDVQMGNIIAADRVLKARAAQIKKNLLTSY